MKNKLKQMERVKEFRQTRERIEEVAVALAGAKVHEAERRLQRAREAELSGAQSVLASMQAGDKGGIPLALRRHLGLDCNAYELQRDTCAETMRLAQAILRARRVESEQAVVLHREMHTAIAELDNRRSETEMVDRFLARNRWRSSQLRVSSFV